MSDARLAPPETVASMVRLVGPSWSVHADDPVESGRHLLHRLRVGTPDGTRTCLLKAKADAEREREAYCAEARLLAVLAEQTPLAVPPVLGVVDDRPDVPTPFFLMGELPGESVHKRETGTLDRETLRRVAVSSGESLARLHALDAVDSYGVIEVACGDPLSGGVPDGALDRLSVPDGDRDWPTHVEAGIEDALAGTVDPRVEGLRAAVDRPACDLVTGLRADGPFDPVVGRVEGSLDNLLFDSPSGEVTGLLDWEFAAATTAAFDLASVAFWLAGGPWGLLPSAPDHRPLVRAGLVEGYGRTGGEDAVREFRARRPLYDLLIHLRTASLFEGMFDPLGADERERDRAAAALRERVDSLLDRA